MSNKLSLFLSCCSCCVLSLLAPHYRLMAQSASMSAAESHRKAEDLLKQMTLDEKVGQMNQSSGLVMPMLGSEKPDALITEGRVGSVLWLTDVMHGYRTVFPVPIAMASSWDPEVEEAAQHLAAQDARAAGIQWTFTPMVDIARDARWGRIVEGA